MGDRTRTKPERKRLADRDRETGTKLTELPRAGPEPTNRITAPPSGRRIFPGAPTSCRCCYGCGGGTRGRLHYQGWFRRQSERFPSFLWSLLESALVSASTFSSGRRGKPAERMHFLPCLWRSVSLVCRWQCCSVHALGPFLPRPSRLKKLRGAFYRKKWRIFSPRLLVQT